MIGQLFTIKCLTNLHVGSGDINFSVIDNEVQRDAITEYPCIYSSSLKGALRDYFESSNLENVIDIFGSDVKNSKDKIESSFQGQVKFMQANMLLLPVRTSTGKYPYYYVTTKEMLSAFRKYCEITQEKKYDAELNNLINLIKDECYTLTKDSINVGVDFVENLNLIPLNVNIKSLLEDLGIKEDRVLILSDDVFKYINLPVVARNSLDDKGISQNLWYEELVPHEAVLYFATLSIGPKDADAVLESFAKVFAEPKYVQFGGNASIGNGICEVKKV